jgi:hypothetical protein
MQEEKPNVVAEMRTNLGSPTAVAFSFDTTGSMSLCINDVRQKLRDLIESMTADIPGLKVALIAHGDYCDGDNVINILDFTDDLEKMMKFVNETPNTGGGDEPECYEYVLNQARFLSWPQEGGSLILIGDAPPHERGHNPNNLDWREEITALKEKNVKVFPMQCLYSTHRTGANQFWEGVSQQSETPLLMLENFKDSTANLEAVAYASAGTEAYGKYMGKFAACAVPVASADYLDFAEEVHKGAVGARLRTANLCSNQAKLADYINTVESKIEPTTTSKVDDNPKPPVA